MSTTRSKVPIFKRYGWLAQTLLATLMALSALYILFSGIDPNDFEASTGQAWTVFQAAEPAIADYLIRLEQLATAGGFAIAMFGVVIGVLGLRNGDRASWFSFWVIPLSYLLFTGIFLLSASLIGYFYLTVAVLQIFIQALSFPVLQGGTR